MVLLWQKGNISEFRSRISEMKLEIKLVVSKKIEIVEMLEDAWRHSKMKKWLWYRARKSKEQIVS